MNTIRAPEQPRSAGIFSKVAIVALLLVFGGCGQKYSHEDFAAVVKDKSPAEVQAAIGKPDAVDESSADTVKWTYKSKTFTVEGGTKFDPKTVIVFHKADSAGTPKVAEVLYE